MSNLLKAWTKSGGRDSFSAVKSMFRDLSMATLIQEGKKITKKHAQFAAMGFTSLSQRVAYWVFGIPSGWLLATWGGMGAEGIWWGLALGLAVAAIALSFRVFIIMKRRGNS